MPPLAQRNLFHDKVRLTVTLTGIVFSVVLIVVQLGLFLGFTTATSNLIDHSGADLWITSKNVPYVEQGVAFSERKLNQVRAVPGVADAQKLIARWTQWKRHDGGQDSVQIVGINVDDTMERPWNLVQGSVEDLNRLGGFIGAMAQSNFDESSDVAPPATDLRTAAKFGARVAEATKRWTDGRKVLTTDSHELSSAA